MHDLNNTYLDIEKNKNGIAILPVGAIEQHGPHLPISVDHFQAEAVSSVVAEKMEAFLLPGIVYGNSEAHTGFRGTVSISSNTLKDIVQDITKNLFNQGFTKVGVLNFHAGNLVLKLALREVNLGNNGGVAVLCQPWQDIDEDCKKILDNYGFEQHAGEFETSIMLHIDSTLVGNNLIDCVPEVQPTHFDYQYMKHYCPDGVWGKPTLASREKGKLLFDAMVSVTVKKLLNTFNQLENS